MYFTFVSKELVSTTNSDTDDEENAEVSVWDFGGQSVFYTTHQMFLSRRAIYILVNDMSKHIDDVVSDDEPYFDCGGPRCLKIEGKTTCMITHLFVCFFSSSFNLLYFMKISIVNIGMIFMDFIDVLTLAIH